MPRFHLVPNKTILDKRVKYFIKAYHGSPHGIERSAITCGFVFVFVFYNNGIQACSPPAPPLLPPSPSVCACVCTQRPEVNQNVPAHIAFHGDAGVRTRVLALV